MERRYRIIVHGDDEQKYGIPELKKYPMPDAKHVRSAIKFFNYVEPKYEKELANAILNRMQEYGMSFDNFTVGEENRFSKYMPKDDELEHHGIVGMKWGQRNGPPYPLQKFQKAAGDAIVKGKRAMGEAYAREKVKYKAKQDQIIKKRKEEKEDLDKRKAELAKRKKLLKMDPNLLTKQELDDLTNRKNSENRYKEAYSKKKKKNNDNSFKDIKKSLVAEIITPTAVELGKAALASMLSGGDFGKIATYRITDRVFKNVYGTQTKDNKQKNNKSSDKGQKNKKESKRIFTGIGTVKKSNLPKGTFRKK